MCAAHLQQVDGVTLAQGTRERQSGVNKISVIFHVRRSGDDNKA
jgi:hypothetical protein